MIQLIEITSPVVLFYTCKHSYLVTFTGVPGVPFGFSFHVQHSWSICNCNSTQRLRNAQTYWNMAWKLFCFSAASHTSVNVSYECLLIKAIQVQQLLV